MTAWLFFVKMFNLLKEALSRFVCVCVCVQIENYDIENVCSTRRERETFQDLYKGKVENGYDGNRGHPSSTILGVSHLASSSLGTSALHDCLIIFHDFDGIS